MENNWAAENLQTIRTLMERSALYRRALAPISTYVGVVGIVAALVGWQLKIEAARWFVLYWMCTSLVAIGGAFLLVRRQAIRDGEPIWSSPTRRIAESMLPALFLGLVIGIIAFFGSPSRGSDPPSWPIVLVWTPLYGLALHAAGAFMPRGIRYFGWAFIIASMLLLWLCVLPSSLCEISAHLIMGILFGLSHLAYGVYLYFTEPRKNEA